jgi:hypothetical protein
MARPGSGYLQVMTHLSGPYEANEADVAEQHQSVNGEEDNLSEPLVAPDEANEADVLEQGAILADDEDDYRPTD